MPHQNRTSWKDWNRAALKPYIDLIEDIYESLIDESSKFYQEFNIGKIEADKLALFVVHSYGNFADFQEFLKTQKRIYHLSSYLCNTIETQLKNFEEDLRTDSDKIDIHDFLSERNFDQVLSNEMDFAQLANKLLALNGESLFYLL